jgi:hypothetical protein
MLRAGFLLDLFSTLKLQVIRSYETSIHIGTTRRNIPEDVNTIRMFEVLFCEAYVGNFAHPWPNSVSNRCIDLEVNLYFSLCKPACVLDMYCIFK